MKSFDGYLKKKLGDSYILLAGGGHKSVSDFAISGHTHNYLPLSGAYITGSNIADMKVNIRNYFNGKPAGTNCYVGSPNIDNFLNDSAGCSTTSVCGIMALNPGYDNYNHGHFLVSHYGDNRIGMIGLGYSTWYGPNWFAYTSDIPIVTNYYWANVKVSASSNTATYPTFANIRSTGRVYLDEWLQFNGSSGLYWPNTNGAHLYANTTTSYGALITLGSRGGYCGLHCGPNNTYMTIMSHVDHLGLYNESRGRWSIYYNRSSDRISIYDSNVDLGYGVQINQRTGIRINSYPSLHLTRTDAGETSMYFSNNTAGWAVGINPWGIGAGLFAIGLYLGTGSSTWRFRIDNNGYCYTNSYLHLGAGNEKNASNPPYVWGVNGSDNYLRTYATSSLSVGYASYSSYLTARYSNCGGIGASLLYLWYDWANTGSLGTYFHGLWCGSPDGNIGYQLAYLHLERTRLWMRTWDYGTWNSWYALRTSADTYVSTYGVIGGAEIPCIRHLLINGVTWWSNWYWSGLGGQPTWLWGSNDGANMYVWNPSNFSVNYANSAGSASYASSVGINYNNDSNSTYQMLWGSGNYVYGTGGIYCNPYYDYLYSGSFYCGNWFRSSGATGWYNESYGGGIYMEDTAYVRTYNSKAFYVSNTGEHAIYTAGSFASAKAGGFLSVYSGGSWYYDCLYNHNNGNMSIDAPGGSLYISYFRGNTYFSGGSYYINRSGYTYFAHYYETSDIRKKNILNTLNITSKQLSEIPIFNFTWKDKPEEGLLSGTSALAVQRILPTLVSGKEILHLDYGVLGTIAGITACKELVTLKSELLQLKEKVKLLEDKLRKYENI